MNKNGLVVEVPIFFLSSFKNVDSSSLLIRVETKDIVDSIKWISCLSTEWELRSGSAIFGLHGQLIEENIRTMMYKYYSRDIAVKIKEYIDSSCSISCAFVVDRDIFDATKFMDKFICLNVPLYLYKIIGAKITI